MTSHIISLCYNMIHDQGGEMQCLAFPDMPILPRIVLILRAEMKKKSMEICLHLHWKGLRVWELGLWPSPFRSNWTWNEQTHKPTPTLGGEIIVNNTEIFNMDQSFTIGMTTRMLWHNHKLLAERVDRFVARSGALQYIILNTWDREEYAKFVFLQSLGCCIIRLQ